AIEEVISKIETESRSITFDINTKDGQATCRSLAAKIASAKSTLDKAGKAKKDEYTVTTKLIDAERNLAKSRMQALQDEIRQPLTELEQREAERKAQHELKIDDMVDLSDLVGAHSSAISARLTALQDKVIDDDWQEYKSQALEAKDFVLKALRSQLAETKQRE